MRYEYEYLRYTTYDQLVARLNEYALEGWRLVHTSPTPACAILEREYVGPDTLRPPDKKEHQDG